MKYLLTIAYDGKNYCGYQVQKNGLSIQETLGKAVAAVFRCSCPITGCSRTDSGVHATNFKATFDTPSGAPNIPIDKIPLALNACLPDDIVILSAQEVSDAFHARYDVKEKEYQYQIYNASIRNPFLIGRAYHYPRYLDENIMNQAAQYLIGTHDFAAFMASGSDVTDTVRTIYDCRVVRQGEMVIITVSGSGFLYHMVRILVGTLISVSEGKIYPADIEKVLASRDRSRAGVTVPACGLYLTRVAYNALLKGEDKNGG